MLNTINTTQENNEHHKFDWWVANTKDADNVQGVKIIDERALSLLPLDRNRVYKLGATYKDLDKFPFVVFRNDNGDLTQLPADFVVPIFHETKQANSPNTAL